MLTNLPPTMASSASPPFVIANGTLAPSPGVL